MSEAVKLARGSAVSTTANYLKKKKISIAKFPQTCPHPFPQLLFQQIYFCKILHHLRAGGQFAISLCKISICITPPLTFSHAYMHGSAIAPLHFQTENTSHKSQKKKKKYAKKFSILSYSCSFLPSVQKKASCSLLQMLQS